MSPRSRKRATRCRPAAIRGRARRKYYEPAGQRGDAPAHRRALLGPDQQEYYKRADTWPLNPEGEVLVVIMCEEKRAIANLPKMLEEVPGIGVVLIGEGDLSQDLGYPAAIRASRGRRRDQRHPGDLQGRTTCPAATRMSTPRTSRS